jgi:hypothetical protein
MSRAMCASREAAALIPLGPQKSICTHSHIATRPLVASSSAFFLSVSLSRTVARVCVCMLRLGENRFSGRTQKQAPEDYLNEKERSTRFSWSRRRNKRLSFPGVESEYIRFISFFCRRHFYRFESFQSSLIVF